MAATSGHWVPRRMWPALATTRLPSNWKSRSELLYDCRFTANQFVLAPSPLRLTTGDFFQLNPCGHSPYVTSSLLTPQFWLWADMSQYYTWMGGRVDHGSSRGQRSRFWLLEFEIKMAGMFYINSGLQSHAPVQVLRCKWGWGVGAVFPASQCI
jgi:hypothetical protein